MLFINPIKFTFKHKLINKCIVASMTKSNINNDIITKEIRAFNVGLSLNLMTKMATDLRYEKNIYDIELFILELFMGYFTYGIDRYRDDGIIDNRQYIYDIVFIIIISIIVHKSNSYTLFPFEILIYSTKYYKDIKQHLHIFKSLYISVLWCISTIILPSILYDGNFDVIQHPLDFMPYIFLLVSTSNNKDLDDIEDDKRNNINTIPVKYGAENAKIFSKGCMSLFIILLLIQIFEKIN